MQLANQWAQRALTAHIITPSYKYYDTSHIDALNKEYLNDNLKQKHSRTNKTFREFFPGYRLYTHIKHDFYTNQLFTGHGAIGTYLKLIGESAEIGRASCR